MTDTPQITAEVSRVVSAFVSNNSISSTELPSLIRSVHDALAGLGQSVTTIPEAQPAVSVKKSVTPDAIVCLECGEKLKMLKRHLRTDHGLTPDEYRAKWRLPADYPMVAPNYATHRSRIARSAGLGHWRRGQQAAE